MTRGFKLHLLQEAGGTANEDQKDRRTSANKSLRRCAPKAAIGSKMKNAVRDRRKSLKRLDRRKINAWISFRFFLDFLPEKLGFPSGEIWISFDTLAPEFGASPNRAPQAGTEKSAKIGRGRRGAPCDTHGPGIAPSAAAHIAGIMAKISPCDSPRTRRTLGRRRRMRDRARNQGMLAHTEAFAAANGCRRGGIPTRRTRVARW
jgi:hypothetical protein